MEEIRFRGLPVWLVALAVGTCAPTPAPGTVDGPSSAESMTPAVRAWIERDPYDAGRPVIRRFGDNEGLPHNTIHALLLDRDGRLWAGTEDGAAFYDGHDWTPLDLPTREHSNFIRSMLQSADGGLWIGTQAAGLMVRRGGQWTVFEPGPAGLPDDRVNTLLETPRADGGSDLWVGTHRAGVARFDGRNWTHFSTAAGLPSPQIWDLQRFGEGADERIWVATGAGVATLRAEDGAIEIPPGSPGDSTSALLATHPASGPPLLWAATYGGGLHRFDGRRWENVGRKEGLPDLFVTDLEPSPSHGAEAFWIATDGGGVALFDGGEIRPLELGATLSSRAAYRLLETTEAEGARALWIGTRSNGVLRTIDGYFRNFQPFPETPSVPVSAIRLREGEAGPSLWLGTDGYGVAVREGGEWRRVGAESGALGNDTVLAIVETERVGAGRRLWIGTRNGGLSELAEGRWRRHTEAAGEIPNDLVQALAEVVRPDGRGELWVGTRTGLAIFDGTRWRRPEPVPSAPRGAIQCILGASSASAAGEVWVGSGEGLFRIRDGVWRSWGEEEGLSNRSIHSLWLDEAPDGGRRLWVGTGGGALLLAPDVPEAKFHTLASEGWPGVPAGPVYSILEDASRRLYLLTNRGIARLGRPERPGPPTVEFFTTEFGLPFNQGAPGAGFRDARGRLWFGTVGGAVVFDPAREHADRTADRILLEARPLDCESCRIFGGQELAHDEGRIAFHYDLLSYFGEPLTAFRTELVGIDPGPGEWTRVNGREVGSLPSGHHLFRVWGRDAAGNVAGPSELAFSIRPAPWEQLWVRASALAAAVASVLLFLRARNRRHERREAELEEQIAARTRRLQRANSLLVELSYVDALTSVPNRRRFEELFAAEWKRSLRTGVPLGLVVLDIDSFKKYNDAFGHQQGDEALRQVAGALADGLSRSGDSVARYGGEEFAVALPSTDVAGAVQVSEQLRRRVEELEIPHAPASGQRVVTVSCGVVSAVAKLDLDAAELFRRADEAMYVAKRAGGNRTVTG